LIWPSFVNVNVAFSRIVWSTKELKSLYLAPFNAIPPPLKLSMCSQQYHYPLPNLLFPVPYSILICSPQDKIRQKQELEARRIALIPLMASGKSFLDEKDAKLYDGLSPKDINKIALDKLGGIGMKDDPFEVSHS
jgi:hypothetical protein